MLAIAWRLDVGALGVSSVPIASFLGSLVAIAIVYGLASSQRRGLSTNVLLLAGVTLNSFFSALILFVQYLADFAESYRTVRWLMGDLDVGSYGPILAALPFIVAAFAVFAMLPRALNLLTMGEDVAASRGVDVGARAAVGVLQRVAGHRCRRIAGRARRLHRHRGAPPGPADGRARTIASSCRRRRCSARPFS